MGMIKAIQSGKEHRHPYYGAKAICMSCRNHGGCPTCYSNRTHKYKIREQKMLDKIREWEYTR
jgi:hypothetical protein